MMYTMPVCVATVAKLVTLFLALPLSLQGLVLSAPSGIQDVYKASTPIGQVKIGYRKYLMPFISAASISERSHFPWEWNDTPLNNDILPQKEHSIYQKTKPHRQHTDGGDTHHARISPGQKIKHRRQHARIESDIRDHTAIRTSRNSAGQKLFDHTSKTRLKRSSGREKSPYSIPFHTRILFRTSPSKEQYNKLSRTSHSSPSTEQYNEPRRNSHISRPTENDATLRPNSHVFSRTSSEGSKQIFSGRQASTFSHADSIGSHKHRNDKSITIVASISDIKSPDVTSPKQNIFAHVTGPEYRRILCDSSCGQMTYYINEGNPDEKIGAPMDCPGYDDIGQKSSHRENKTSSYISTRISMYEPRLKRWIPRVDQTKWSHLTPPKTELSHTFPIRNRIEAKVGVLVVVENSIYRQYLLENGNNPRLALAGIRRYYGMVFAMIDQRFQTIKDPYLSITVKISSILIAETREDSCWLENVVDWSTMYRYGRGSVYPDNALKKFTHWISNRTDLSEYDHAMVFTAYRLTNKQNVGLGGMAYLNAICDTQSGNAVSMVADRGDFQCVKVATHELAHSLGASHDGDGYSKSCRADSNFIMSPLTSHENHQMKNAFYFSPCSIRDMLQHLSKPASECIKNEVAEYYSYNVDRFPPGQFYSADTQCKLVFGKKSELCKEGTMANVMCGQLWCRDPNKEKGCRTNAYLTALPGTQCAPNKVCHLGECVIDNRKNAIQRQPISSSIKIIPSLPQSAGPSLRMRGPGRPETKPLHEKPRLGKQIRRQRRNKCTEDQNKKYCEGLITLNPRGCKRKEIRRYCCLTCKQHQQRHRQQQ